MSSAIDRKKDRSGTQLATPGYRYRGLLELPGGAVDAVGLFRGQRFEAMVDEPDAVRRLVRVLDARKPPSDWPR